MTNYRLRKMVQVLSSAVLLGVLLLGTPRQAAAASIIYVKQNASGANNGTSWANAYKSLAVALNHAVSGQQVWVAGGTYKPTRTTDRTKSFALKSGVKIYGGFAGTETSLSQRHWKNHGTVLSGDIDTTGTYDTYDVVTASNVDNTSLLDGFQITGGNANCGCFPGDAGGGIFLWNSSPVLRNLAIGSNTASGYGGGMYNSSSNPTLRNVIFVSNAAGFLGHGGGMYNEASSPDLLNVIFYGNAAVEGGGMINADGSSPTLTDVTFMGNSASANGGGMLNNASSPTLVNVTFQNNNSGAYGGAIYNTGSSPLLKNVTVSGNTATTWGGGMYSDNSSNSVAQNSIFWGDNTEVINTISAATMSDTIVQGGCPSNTTCINVINADPVLGTLQKNGGFTWTMALGSGSAALDTGGADVACAPKDQRGVKRPQGAACDIGAYEVKVAKFVSAGAYDGQVVESGENSNAGGTANSTSQTFRVGDTAANQQLRGFLSFDTSRLPDGATLVAGVMKLRKQGITGYDPFITHGNLLVDLKSPYFGTGIGLVASDFQATGLSYAGVFEPTPAGGWYSGALVSTALPAVNKTGPTQLRLGFTWDDDNDGIADNVSFYSGDTTTAANRPILLIYYNP